MVAYMKTDIGMVRKTNEDSLSCLPPHLYVVADGMGGHAAGEIASQLAADNIKKYFQNSLPGDSPQYMLECAIQQANAVIYQMAQSKNEYLGMGTTVTAAYLDNGYIHWGHVGDSRMYLIQNSGMQQLTRDHSLVWDLLESGSITKEEASNHPQRNLLTRALGTGPDVAIEIGRAEWNPGDKLLLCSDGLTGMLEDPGILKIVEAAPNVEAAVETLIDAAKAAGGLDNITVILIEYGDV